MDLFAPVDIYCERTHPGFWAEPANALTNFAFFVAAFYAFRLWKKRERILGHAPVLPLLAFTIFLVGVGSFAFHTFANRITGFMDSFFIAVFMYVYLGTLLRKVFELQTRGIVIGLVGFFAVGVGFLMVVPSDMFNGTEQYFACIIAFAALIMGSINHAKNYTPTLVVGMLAFIASMFFRSMDMSWCESYPLGVHFIWHVLNGLVLALLMRYLILNYPSDDSDQMVKNRPKQQNARRSGH